MTIYAFPTPDVERPNGSISYGVRGMTLQDWFAGQVLPGLFVQYKLNPDADLQVVAETAYRMAAAMIAHRKAHA